MINRLIDISDISVIDQNKGYNLYSFSSIDFSEAINEGGFGSIHEILAIDGQQTGKDYLLKIPKKEPDKAYEIIKHLHLKLRRYQRLTKLPIYHTNPEFLGLPFAVFKAKDEDDEKNYVGFVMFNLENLGFEDYGSDSEPSVELNNLEITDKLYLSYQLSKAVDFLHDYYFIHSDIKEASIFINPHRKQLALIDYDSGCHSDKQKKPITLGAVGQWISKKWRHVLKTNNSDDISFEDRINEEKWRLAQAIFQLLFNVPPFFFLNDIDDQEEYLKQNKWPNTNNDKSNNIFNKNNLVFAEDIIKYLENLSENGLEIITNAFESVFNEGFNRESKRLSASEWKNILSEIVNELEPNIIEYKSDKITIRKQNEPILFDWRIDTYNYVLLKGELIDINRFSKEIFLKDSDEVVLSVVNDFNKAERYIRIGADKKEPEIININISSKIRKSESDFITVNWEVKYAEKVRISSIKEELNPKAEVKLYPSEKTKYQLTAIGFFGQEITKEFELDVIKPKIKDFHYEINIELGIDNIDLFWKVENTNKIEINPIVGKIEDANIKDCHIKIREKTNFTLIAYGDFGIVEKIIEAQPFPIPIIKELIFDFPKLERTFKSTNFLNWNEINKNRLNLIHPEFQIIIPDLNYQISKESPSFDSKLSIDLSQKLNSKVTIKDLDFVSLGEELTEKYKKKNEKNN